MQKVYGILFLLMLLCVGCEWQLKPNSTDTVDAAVQVERYDRIETLYLSTGDPSALQQMNTSYPMQTRMLIEDILRIGKVNEPQINSKFLHFFQDTTLQQLLVDVKQQYDNMDDVQEELTSSFLRLKEELPTITIPRFYTQVGSFDQSIIVGMGMLGISLDKYLGSDYPFYIDHYTEEQRRLMVRQMIVPDCLAFFLLSQFPLSPNLIGNTEERDKHMGRIQWVVNEIVGRKVFANDNVVAADSYMKRHKQTGIDELLSSKNI